MSGSRFEDHFSGHASAYRSHRPTYPASLFASLASLAPGHALAWDAGCGNGQAAVGLAGHFDQVVATDPSAQQIASATPYPRVRYLVEPAEQSSLALSSADLITVAQALHWFDLDRFYPEVRRVARPGAILAAWTYVQAQVTPAVDAVVHAFYHGLINPYWPQDRQKVERGYEDLAFPFDAVDPGRHTIEMIWTADQLGAYIATWSAVQRYRAATGQDPMPAFTEALENAWGDPQALRPVRWPLHILCGRVSG